MNKKRLLSLILSLCMVFSIMQTNVFALSHYNTGECGALLDNGVLTISGAGKTYDHNNYFPQPWLTQIDTIHTVIINDEVTGIGNNTFKYMRALKNVTIGKNVSELGVNAFLGCENLENIYWNATSIKDLNEKNTIFSECGTSSNGITITFGKNVDYIPAKTFWCETAPKIKKVIFNGPVEIGYSAFALCDKMEVHISSITDWCQSKFKNTDSNPLMAGSSLYLNGTIVKDLKTPNTLKEINENTFMGCTDLETVTIKDGLTKIGSGAFYDCSNLKKIYLPKSLTNIGKYAFDIGRSKNLDIYYAGTEAEWNAISKNNYLDTDFVNLTMHYNEIYEKKDFEGLTLENKEYTYDGTEKELLVSGNLPAGTTIEYENNKATNAGTYNATAIVKALGYYDLSLSATLKINPKALTITGLSAQDKIYDGTDKATLSGGALDGVVTGDDVSANIPTEGKFADKNVGNNKAVTINTIALSGVKSGNYTLTQPTGLKANVTQKEIAVTADNQQMIKNGTMPALTYTADDLCDGDSFTGKLTTKADGTKTGDFDIEQGTLTAGNNYKINFTKGTLTVSDKTPQEATVSTMPEKTYGDEGFKVEVTNDKNTDLGKFTFESSNTNVATIDQDGNVTIKNAGDTNIIVKRSGNDTYADFEKSQKLTVKKVAITVNADAKSKRVGTDDPDLTYQYVGTLVGTDNFTGELKRAEGETVGKYDILQNTLKINDNYEITYNKAIFEILEKTPQTITFADFGNKTYGDEAFKVTVTPDATSELSNFTYASDNENVATISADGTITIVGAGEANITVTEAGNADYAQATVTKKLTVAKKALEIKVDNIEITYGEEINPNISYNGFITGEDKTVLTKPIAVSGYSAKPNVGTYTITLSGAEAANYEISYTGAILTVNKKDITVTALKVFDKAADETTNATINTSSLVFDGMILGDDVSIDLENANATFAQAEVGENIAVNVTGLALTGADAGNYNLTNATFETTANIKDSITAADIAAQINEVSVVTDSTEIKLPNVPTGYKIVVKSSNNEAVIKADGTVAPVESNTDVKLTFSIVNENDETDVAETGEITVTVPASTKVKIDVTAEANGTVTGSGEYLKNSEVTVVATPDSGYKFDGWYNGDTSVSTSASYTFKAESDISLVAKFSRKSTGGGGGGGSSVSTYTVKFETNGGNTIDSVKVDKNKTVAEPTAPTKDGFEFAGWYADKALTTKYDFDTKVTKGITLYAAWTEKKTEVKDDDTEPTTPESKITFTDVKENDWFAENVKYVAENGLMNGTTSTEFAPNDNLTRAMLVTILYRAAGEPETNKSVPFADVTSDSYYANAVIWAQQNGIVSGVNENEFAPDENITREQIATIIYRYAQYKGYDTSIKADISAYADADEISEYATEAMQYAVASGLIKGKTETTLNPQDNATRAEIAAILQRFIEANK